MAGELDAEDPHVQFDEEAQETCDSATRRALLYEALVSSIMGPQTRVLFSLSGSLQPNSTQQFVPIINDPLV